MTLDEALNADYVSIDILDTLKREKYVINKNTPKHLISLPEVLYMSLEHGFSDTMNFLSKNLNSLKLLNKDRKRFISILRDKKYYFMKNHIIYVKFIPDLLLCPLNDDFDQTIKELLRTKDNKQIELSQQNHMFLRKILLKNKFILTEETIPLILKNREFLIVSLKNDYNLTMEVLKNCKYKVDFSLEDNKEISKILISNKFDYTDDIPLIFKDKIGAVIAGINKDYRTTLANFDYGIVHSQEEKDWLIKELDNNMVPYASYTERMLNDSYILNSFIKDKEEVYFIINNLLAKEMEYTREDELRLLDFLNSESYSVEEELKKMHENDLDRNSMSLTQFLVFSMYIRKRLYEEKISGYSINLFEYNKEKRNIAGTVKDTFICLYNFKSKMTIFDILLTLNHEFYHVVQKRDMTENRIYNDRDVDLYSKDDLLYAIDTKYYDDNYRSVSYEFDAEFKAFLASAVLLGIDEEDYINRPLDKITVNDLIDYTRLSTTYSQNNLRVYKGEKQHLDEAFQQCLKEQIKEKGLEHFKCLLKYRYPIISYEYDISENGVKRKTIEELVHLIDTAVNPQERTIYAHLIEKRLDYQDAEYEKNEKELIELGKKNYTSPTTNILINKILTNIYSIRCDRYFKYINEAIKLKKKHNKH